MTLLRRSHTRVAGLIFLLTTLFVVLLGLPRVGASAMNQTVTGATPLTDAWAAAQARGAYRFTSDITQTTIPQATLANVGSSSREERLYLEGEADLRSESMALKLWSDGWAAGGSALIPASGIEIRTADGKTQARRAGEPILRTLPRRVHGPCSPIRRGWGGPQRPQVNWH